MSEELPGSLCGGEPSLHCGFYTILREAKGPFDLLTNGQMDLNMFLNETTPAMFRMSLGKHAIKEAWFSSIRISYHAARAKNDKEYEDRLLFFTNALRANGYKAGITCPDLPNEQDRIDTFERTCRKKGVPFHRKEFLGCYEGKLYGTYKYENGLDGVAKTCECKSNELLIAPDGQIYKCHRDLYSPLHIGNITDPNYAHDSKFRICKHFGECSPCDLKSKMDKDCHPGHCAVEVKNIGDGIARLPDFEMPSTCPGSVAIKA
jgi:radical SAM protein with 4Fe4S-binding SPASM domain